MFRIEISDKPNLSAAKVAAAALDDVDVSFDLIDFADFDEESDEEDVDIEFVFIGMFVREFDGKLCIRKLLDVDGFAKGIFICPSIESKWKQNKK